jgi:hypothetical protein
MNNTIAYRISNWIEDGEESYAVNDSEGKQVSPDLGSEADALRAMATAEGIDPESLEWVGYESLPTRQILDDLAGYGLSLKPEVEDYDYLREIAATVQYRLMAENGVAAEGVLEALKMTHEALRLATLLRQG